MPHSVTILLVEDNPDDAKLTQAALGQVPAYIEVAPDGERALDYLLDDRNELPRLVILDLRLPNTGGLEVLRRVRQDPRTRLVPVVILTSSDARGDILAGYRYGANSYVRKPVDFDEFRGLIRQLGLYWLVVNERPPNSEDQ